MKQLLVLFLCASALVLSPAAAAAKKKPAKGTGKKAKASASAARERASETGEKGKKGKQDLKFSGLKLKGDLKKPDLSYIYKRRGVKDEQIVNIPTDFNDEIRQGENQF